MRVAVLLTLALLLCPSAGAGEPARAADPPAPGRLRESTAGGRYVIELSVKGGALRTGANALDLVVRDAAGAAVAGAQVGVTPWMPDLRQGVWEKPEVTDRGGGSYLVQNVNIILEGRWEIRVAVKSGVVEDRAVFAFTVGGAAAPGKAATAATKPKGYLRAVKYYQVPDVTLINQDGKRVKLRALLDAGKPVMIDFIYTTCTTICPILSSGFSSVRDALGDQAAGGVQLASLSIDPEHDRPEQMKEYLSRYGAGEGWDFLTGSREDIEKVLRAFDALVPDKMSHQPVYLIRGPRSGDWVRIDGLVGRADLLRELRSVEGR
jgi:protein SCO1/2